MPHVATRREATCVRVITDTRATARGAERSLQQVFLTFMVFYAIRDLTLSEETFATLLKPTCLFRAAALVFLN